jgi:hypothetical protein
LATPRIAPLKARVEIDIFPLKECDDGFNSPIGTPQHCLSKGCKVGALFGVVLGSKFNQQLLWVVLIEFAFHAYLS